MVHAINKTNAPQNAAEALRLWLTECLLAQQLVKSPEWWWNCDVPLQPAHTEPVLRITRIALSSHNSTMPLSLTFVTIRSGSSLAFSQALTCLIPAR